MMNSEVALSTLQTNSQRLQNAYTDAPQLHPNLILGSLHLLFWLLCHPSAWRNYVVRIDPTLSPDFCLAELSPAQRRNPALRQLLIQCYIVCPLLVGLWVGLVVWGLGESEKSIIAHALAGVTYTLAGSVAVGMIVGLGPGLIYGVGLSFIAFGPTLLQWGIPPLDNDIIQVYVRAGTYAVAAGLAGSVAVNITQRTPNYSWTQQLGGVFIGMLVGSGITGAAYVVASRRILWMIQQLWLYLTSTNLNKSIPLGLAGGVLFSLAYSLALGWRTDRWRYSMMGGLVFGIVGGGVYGLIVGMGPADLTFTPAPLTSIGGGLLFGGLLVLTYILAKRLGGPWAGAIASALVSGLAWVLLASSISPVYPEADAPLLLLSVAGILLGLTYNWWRPILLYLLLSIYNPLLFHLDKGRPMGCASLLRYHSAFWDEGQRLPLVGLDDHLVWVTEHNPAEGYAAIEYLSASPQRWAAQATQIELDARFLERCTTVQAIREAHGYLEALLTYESLSHHLAPGTVLSSFSRLSQDVKAALNQVTSYNQRLSFIAVEDRLCGLLRELTRSHKRDAIRFRPVANQWHQIVTDHIRKLSQEVEQSQEIENPYVIGIPLTAQQEIFVGRMDIVARVEQLLLRPQSPPLLLYGQRRMGKTSLLRNLSRLLPGAIVPLFVDGQAVSALARDYADLLCNIADEMARSAGQEYCLALPPLNYETLQTNPLRRFNDWLDNLEQALATQERKVILLALDELEMLESSLNNGRFNPAELLSLLRHLIQHRPHFKLLFASSHTLTEFQHLATYLINAYVVKIGYLDEVETHKLIEQPVKDFELGYDPEASQRIFELTRGHPALVQLLCYELVTLKNQQQPAVRRLARLADVEAAVPQALSGGSLFFANIEQEQDQTALVLLRFLAAQGEGAVVSRPTLIRQIEQPDHLDQTLVALLRRDLIEPINGGYRFQVELIRRWFALQER